MTQAPTETLKDTEISRARRLPQLEICAALLILAVTLFGCTTTPVDTSAMSFSSEPLVGKIVWNDLVTDDIEAARRFYGELFGWSFEPSTGSRGRPYVVARSGRMLVAGIVQAPKHSDGATYSRWLPYASVKDVDAAVATAVSTGAKLAVPPKKVGVGRIAVIIDSEGAVMGLARSRIGDPDDRTTAPGIGRVVWTELLANDPDTAARFYSAVIGYVAHTVDRHGGPYMLLASGLVDRAGIFQNPSDQAAPVWLTSFGVDDVAAATARVEALGGKVILPPSAQLRGGTTAVVEDPTGALLVLRKT